MQTNIMGGGGGMGGGGAGMQMNMNTGNYMTMGNIGE
jgi:hypothetical protein